jgi:hypothetical protein
MGNTLQPFQMVWEETERRKAGLPEMRKFQRKRA